MIIIWGAAVGFMLIAHYVLWIGTTTWKEFLIYFAIMHTFGFVFGVLPGLKWHREVKEIKRELVRKEYLRQLRG